jgi:NAD(P)-dependent dehydrogenase (short-subunit alcohol dehydrogenase family)
VLDVLRPGVLDGLAVAVAGDAPRLGERLSALGAEVGAPDDHEHVDVLVVDAAAAFAAAGGAMAGLRAAVDGSWDTVRDVATACWTGGDAAGDGGKVVLVAPPAGAGEHASAVGAALENLARTLSVEWARFGVRVTAIRPGTASTGDEVAEIAAFLASPAGDYHTGSTFTLAP